jgi:uncharacterized membrane protein
VYGVYSEDGRLQGRPPNQFENQLLTSVSCGGAHEKCDTVMNLPRSEHSDSLLLPGVLLLPMHPSPTTVGTDKAWIMANIFALV